MIYRTWSSINRLIYQFSPLLIVINLILFTIISIYVFHSDALSYAIGVLKPEACDYQSSICVGFAHELNNAIINIFGFKYIERGQSHNEIFKFVQTIFFFIVTLLSISLISRSFPRSLSPISLKTCLSYLLVFPCFLFILEPAKETFQFLSIAILMSSYSLMFYRKLLYSILLFSLSVFVAYNSHALFYYPVIISYLIVLLWHKCVSPWLSTRPNSSSLYRFLGILLLISGTIAIYI